MRDTAPDVAGLLKDRAAITAAIRRAVQEAVLAHARAGQPVAEWRDGQVIWVTPDEILRRFATPGSQEPARPDVQRQRP